MSLSIDSNYTANNSTVNTSLYTCLRDGYTFAYSEDIHVTHKPRMSIANRLDEAMQRAGFKSQAALARASGLAQPTVNRILKGLVPTPDAETIARLAEACGVDVGWLMGTKDNAGNAVQHRVAELQANYTTEDDIELGWMTRRERALFSKFRASTEAGKTLIEDAAEIADKDLRRLKSVLGS